MKKALALVLALVLALSMAVSAFGITYETLTKVETTTGKTAITATATLADSATTNDNPAVKVVNSVAGGKLYVAVDTSVYYKDTIKVETNGNVTATLIDYDPEKMTYAAGNLTYSLYNNDKQVVACPDANNDGVCDDNTSTDGRHNEHNHLPYDTVAAIAKTWNDAYHSTAYSAVCDQSFKLIEITVAPNYTAHYTEGYYTISATCKADNKTYAAKTIVINDVVIFEYEMVKWASKNVETKELVLDANAFKGYSDYLTAIDGYKDATGNYNSEALKTVEDPYVISTTGFRGIWGQDIAIAIPAEGYSASAAAGYMAKVYIEDVAETQKGVNFTYYGFNAYNKDGKSIASLKADTTADNLQDLDVTSVKFGFRGNQVIASDFSVAVVPGITWFQLRELFGEKIEEDDIITYYLLKDGKVEQEYKVDYKTIAYNDAVEIELELSNETLGQYELVLEVPASESAAEENPNTGAESVVGVVAALAVVSLASAAAVSLKK